MTGNKKILVTGASGFIGSVLVSNLAGEGCMVNALVRNPDKARLLLPDKNVTIYQGDITQPVSLEKAAEGCEEIFHLGSFVDLWSKDRSKIYEINVTGTRNVIEAGINEGSQRMLFVSTAGVWGPSLQRMTTEESKQVSSPFTDYERSKKQAEDEIRNMPLDRMKIVIVNPTRVFGPGPLIKSNVSTYFKQYLNGRLRFLPGNGDQIANYVYIGDLIRGMKQAILHGEHKENYILGGENATFNELFASVAKIAGKKYQMIPVPATLILFFSYFEQWKADILGMRPLITPGFAKKYSSHWKISSEKAQKNLGYKISPLEESLKETVEWLKSQI